MSGAGIIRPGAIVIGGGIVGVSCALALQRRGMPVSIIDPGMLSRSASFGNAGHIATEQVEPLASPGALKSLPRRLFSRGGAAAFPARDIGVWLPFGWRLLRAARRDRFVAGTAALKGLLAHALPAWHRLTRHATCESLLADDGHYIVWERDAAAKAGLESWRRTETGTARFADISREDAARIEALTGRQFAGGIRFSGTARVRDPGGLHEALSRAFTAQGGHWQRGNAARISLAGHEARVVLESGEQVSAGLILVAAGVASADLLAPLGHRAPIIAERGYHLQAAQHAWPDMPPVVFEERSMIVSRFDSGLRAASFVEFSRVSRPPDPRKWHRLRAHASDLNLPMEEAREWIGVRPTLPDYLPAIGRSARANNLAYAFGHQHLGLTLAAITGELVAAMAAGEPAAVDRAPFSLARFGTA